MLTPGNLREPVEVVARDVRFGCRRFEMCELGELLFKYALDGLRHGELLRAGLELLDELVLAVAFHAELFLDTLELLHEVILALALRDLAIYVARKLGLQLGIDQLFFENEKCFTEAIFDDEGLQDVLKFTHFTCRDCSSKVCELVGFVKDIGRNLVDGKVGDLIAEERIQLGDVLEDGYDLGHERTDVLVVFVVGLREEVVDVHDRDVVILEEGGLQKR